VALPEADIGARFREIGGVRAAVRGGKPRAFGAAALLVIGGALVRIAQRGVSRRGM
jgi:hypothetical protein